MSAATINARWIQIATFQEFRGQRQLVRKVGNLDVLLLRVSGDVIAVYNHCTHVGKSLEGGRVMGGQITCPFHGACFDLQSGAAVSGPAVAPLHLFPVKIEGEDIHVDLSETPDKAAVDFCGGGTV